VNSSENNPQDYIADKSHINCQSPDSKSKKYRTRSILIKEQVIEIFEHKKTLSGSERITSVSISLARKYHVSSKTIRDIWNRRSWQRTTSAHCQEVISFANTTILALAFVMKEKSFENNASHI
jgi:Flp pilus assembly protein TadB